MESNKANNHQNLSNMELLMAVVEQLELEDARNARNPDALSPTSTEALIASIEGLLISKLKDRTDIETAHDLFSQVQITALQNELNYRLNCNEGLEKDLEKDLDKGLDKSLEKGLDKDREKSLDNGLDIAQVIVLDIKVVAPPPRTFLFLGCLPMPLSSVVKQEVLLMVPTFFRKLMGWKEKVAPATKPARPAGPKAKKFGGEPGAKGFGGETGRTAATDVFDVFFGRPSNGKKMD